MKRYSRTMRSMAAVGRRGHLAGRRRGLAVEDHQPRELLLEGAEAGQGRLQRHGREGQHEPAPGRADRFGHEGAVGRAVGLEVVEQHAVAQGQGQARGVRRRGRQGRAVGEAGRALVVGPPVGRSGRGRGGAQACRAALGVAAQAQHAGAVAVEHEHLFDGVEAVQAGEQRRRHGRGGAVGPGRQHGGDLVQLGQETGLAFVGAEHLAEAPGQLLVAAADGLTQLAGAAGAQGRQAVEARHELERREGDEHEDHQQDPGLGHGASGGSGGGGRAAVEVSIVQHPGARPVVPSGGWSCRGRTSGGARAARRRP